MRELRQRADMRIVCHKVKALLQSRKYDDYIEIVDIAAGNGESMYTFVLPRKVTADELYALFLSRGYSCELGRTKFLRMRTLMVGWW